MSDKHFPVLLGGILLLCIAVRRFLPAPSAADSMIYLLCFGLLGGYAAYAGFHRRRVWLVFSGILLILLAALDCFLS